MKFLGREAIRRLKAAYPEGARVQLIWMDDSQAPDIGELGTVIAVDDAGTVHVHWDCGSSLGVIPDVDAIRRLPICPNCGQAYAGNPVTSRLDKRTPICPGCAEAEAIIEFEAAQLD